MLDNSDSYPLSRHGRAPYPVMAGLDPAIRRGTSLRQMADWVAGRDEWVATNEKWYKKIFIPFARSASKPASSVDFSGPQCIPCEPLLSTSTTA
jgi:hypothetical protein